MVDIVGLYDSLLNASYGGVQFYMLPADIEVGRRVQRFLFPGQDATSFQDLGAADGKISVQGFLIGEDYIAQSLALRAAFRKAGPATLVHPWLGTMQVVQIKDQLPKLSFTDKELRVCRFQAVFYPYTPPPQIMPDTLSRLMSAVSNATSSAEAWLAAVLAPAAGVLGAFSYAQGWIAGLEGQFGALINTGPSGSIIGPVAGFAVTALGAPVLAVNALWAAATANALAGVPAAIAGACAPTIPSAVAPGGTVTAAAAAAPGDAAAMLLASLGPIAAGLNAPTPGPALASAMLALVLANAVQAASNISYTSQQQAQAQGALIYAAFDTAIPAAALAAASAPALGGAVWGALLDLKAAFAADMNALIGRLPPVVNIAVPNTMPAWLLAQYISGDNPADVFATWQDIVARNNIRNPGAVPPGSIEALAS